MPTKEVIWRVFCIVDAHMVAVKKRADAQLYPSEIVTLGRIFALKGGKYRPLDRWVHDTYCHLFPQLAEQSRMQRLLRDYGHYTPRFVNAPSTLRIIDTFGIALVHPRRAGRRPQQIGRKGLSHGRWMVGITLAWLINDLGEVVDWGWGTAHEHANTFRESATQFDGETITVSDPGFRKQHAPQQNFTYCEKGTWNERYLIASCFSVVAGFLQSKNGYQRDEHQREAR